MSSPIARFLLFRRTLLGKLSLSYLSLTIIFGILYGLSFYSVWKSYANRYSQGLQWEVAGALADDLAPHTAQVLDRAAVEASLLRFRSYNPGAEPFVLGEDGTVVAALVPTSERVPVQAIQSFAEHAGYPLTPLYGPQPQPTFAKRQILFSAHPLVIEGKGGYVYVSLESTAGDVVQRTLGDVEASFAAFLLVAVSSVAAGAIGFVVFRHLTRRLAGMSVVLENYGRGDYTQRMPVDGSDELTAFARVLNTMADAILAQIEKLKQVDSVRRHLVASVTHDIRNPLAQMRVRLEAARDIPDATEQSRIEHVHSSLRALDTLSALIEDLFELSKISADGYAINREPVELSELLSDLAISFTPVAEQKEITLLAEIEQAGCVVQADLRLISRALSNLLDNAIKYSEPGTTVTLTLQKSAHSARLSVRDHGSGFDPEELETLAQPFHRGRSASKNKSGTGLGLAIARKTVELHGGTFTLKNTEPHGAEVVIEMPR